MEARLGVRALVLTSASMGVAQLSFIPLLLRSVAQSCPTLYHSSVQAPLVLGLSRQDYWSEWPFPSPRNLPDPGVELESLESPALAGRVFTTSTTWDAS